MPTVLTTATRHAIRASISRQASFASESLFDQFLGEYERAVTEMLNPRTVTRPDRITPENPQGFVEEGFSSGATNQRIKELLDEFSTETLLDDARIKFAVKTNEEVAAGARTFIESNDPLAVEAAPGWELVRQYDREVPRGFMRGAGGVLLPDPENAWDTRWRNACYADPIALAAFEATGRMVALKSSPAWQALGDGAGGYEDTLGQPFPPFAFNSGMDVDELSPGDCAELGLLAEGQVARPAALDFANLFGT